MNNGKYIEAELKIILDEWKQKQKGSIKYQSRYKFLNRDIFILDGLIDSNKWDAGSRALYISHEINNRDFSGLFNTDPEDMFYIKNQYEGKYLKDSFYRNLERLHKHLFGKDDLGDAAFLNIYKRDNINILNYESINTYTYKYSDFIIREIKLIEPKVIISLGVFNILNNKRLFKEFDFIQDNQNEYLYKLNLLGKEIPVLDMYHPAKKEEVRFINTWYKKRFGDLTFINK